MDFARYCRQLTIPFFTLYRRRVLKLSYCPVKSLFRYTDVLNPWSEWVINISRKDNLWSCYFSIVNCRDGWIEFICSICAWTSSLWDQRRNVPSTYPSHIDGFSDEDINVISSKYSINKLANNGDNRDPIARRLLAVICQTPFSTQKVNISIRLSWVSSSSEGSVPKLSRTTVRVSSVGTFVNGFTTSRLTIFLEWMAALRIFST